MSDAVIESPVRVPAEGETREMAPGVRWLRMPLPMAGLDHINLWLLDDGDGWTIVDSGLGTPRIKELWEHIFAHELGGRPVTRLICTHFHPDHLGQAGWIVERTGAEFVMTAGEWTFGRMRWLGAPAEVPAQVIGFDRAAGFDATALDQLRQRGYGNFRKGVREVPRTFRRIADGDHLKIGGRRWSVRVGRGHSPEHACLYCPELDVLISGDQILPKISPHIGVYPGEPEANPLRQYLASLDRFRDLPATTLVLPSHRDPFVNAGPRLDALLVHHRERLDRLTDALSEPCTAAETMPALFRRAINGDNMFLAIAEALAHLNYLMAEGRVGRERGADGVDRYRLAA